MTFMASHMFLQRYVQRVISKMFDRKTRKTKDPGLEETKVKRTCGILDRNRTTQSSRRKPALICRWVTDTVEGSVPSGNGSISSLGSIGDVNVGKKWDSRIIEIVLCVLDNLGDFLGCCFTG